MNLYAGIHERSHLRYDVYCSLVRVAGQTDNVNALFRDVTKVISTFSLLNLNLSQLVFICFLFYTKFIENAFLYIVKKILNSFS